MILDVVSLTAICSRYWVSLVAAQLESRSVLTRETLEPSEVSGCSSTIERDFTVVKAASYSMILVVVSLTVICSRYWVSLVAAQLESRSVLTRETLEPSEVSGCSSTIERDFTVVKAASYSMILVVVSLTVICSRYWVSLVAAQLESRSVLTRE